MRLICFGDSWTAGHGIEEDLKYKEEPFPHMFIQKLRATNSWPRYVADKLNCPYINLGVCGYGNEYILKDLQEIIKNDFLKKDDVIIIMFSYPYRYKSKDRYSVVEIYLQMEELLNEYKHFYFNSFYPTFQEEDVDIKKLPYYFINPESCVSDVLKKYETKKDLGIWEYGKRSVWNDEKNYYEGDYHPNLDGYKIIANHIYKSIKNYV